MPQFSEYPPALRLAMQVAHTLDCAFVIPIIRRRIGWDSILGLVPAVGDAVTVLVIVYFFWVAWQLKMPWQVYPQMVGNVLLDFAVGTVPLAGDVFDIAWKSNKRNAELLKETYEKHYGALPKETVIDVTWE